MTFRPVHALLGFMRLSLTATTAPFEGLKATYRHANNVDLLTVEVSADGKARITASDGSYSLIIGNKGYDVQPGPGGPLVVNYDVNAWLMAEDMRTGRVVVVANGVNGRPANSESTSPPELIAHGERKIGNWSGTAFAPKGAKYTTVVVSDDPQLAPLGAPLGTYFALVGKARPGGPDPDDAVLESFLVGKGVLAFWNYDLEKVEPGPIDPARLSIPAKAIELADIQPRSELGNASSDTQDAMDAHFLGERLLVLSSDGTITAWREGASNPEPFPLPEKTQQFCTSGGETWLATGISRNEVTIWGGRPGAWRKLYSPKQGKGERFALIDCTGPEPLILTSKGIRNLITGKLVPITFPKGMKGGDPVSLQHGGFLYVGMNAGEWGGGLVRLPLAGGAGALVDASDDTELCGGTLNRSCDPVTGLAPDPSNSNCVLATVGLTHFVSHGSIVRVCGDKISVAYAKPFTIRTDWTFDPANPIPSSRSSVPFYAMSHSQRGVWAVGSDGYYRFGAGPVPQFSALPWRLDGFIGDVNWTHADFVLVRTAKNRRHSLSGASLMIVAR